MTYWQATVLLFFVMDPIGNVPLYVAALRNVPEHRRVLVAARELIIALLLLALFWAGGPRLLTVLGISEAALEVGGAIVLFLIAIRMVFPPERTVKEGEMDSEPFVVPLAIPLVAGPSAIATVLFVVTRDPDRRVVWLGAIVTAWIASAAILLSASALSERLGPRAMTALERLMGMLLVTLSVEMIMDGVGNYVTGLGAEVSTALPHDTAPIEALRDHLSRRA